MVVVEKKNSKMTRLQKKRTNQKNQLNISLENLNKLFNPKFVVSNDCVLISRCSQKQPPREYNTSSQNLAIYDKTELESSINEELINSYVNVHDRATLLKISELVMQSWEHKLLAEFSTYSFAIILSIHDDDQATLRFHRLRDDEEPWLLSDLEGYKMDAILVHEIHPDNDKQSLEA